MQATGAIGARAATLPAANVAAATGVAPVARAATAEAPIELELLGATPAEVEEANRFAEHSSISVVVVEREVSVEREIADLEKPVVNRSIALMQRRDQLRRDVIEGRVDARAAHRTLADLDSLIDRTRKAEEKRQFIKDLLISLMLGSLTPAMIAEAKQFGLVVFLVDAIASLAAKGKIAPKDAKAMATMLAQVGEQVPMLDNLVEQDVSRRARAEQERRAAQGLEPLATGPDGALVAATNGSSHLNAR